jgi:hypothetical protein
MPLTPPPDQLFPTQSDLINGVQAHAAAHGFAITTLRSKKNKDGNIYKIWLKCDHGGRYLTRGLTQDTRARLTGTCCIEYPYLSVGKMDAFKSWVLVSSVTLLIALTNNSSQHQIQTTIMKALSRCLPTQVSVNLRPPLAHR